MKITAAIILLLLSTGCASSENGEWTAEPIQKWRCPSAGYHGFVLDAERTPLSGVYVEYRPRPTGDVAEVADSNNLGAWEMCRTGGVDATLTFHKEHYEPLVVPLKDLGPANAFNVTLRSAHA